MYHDTYLQKKKHIFLFINLMNSKRMQKGQ